MLRSPLIAAGLAIIGLIVVLLVVSLAQQYKHLNSVRKELATTNGQVVKLQKAIANQKTELDAVNKARSQLQGHLDEATSDNDQLRKELDASESQLKEKESQAQD
jgi:septal ring factor EnvC (AmiA/AmiB activator)